MVAISTMLVQLKELTAKALVHIAAASRKIASGFLHLYDRAALDASYESNPISWELIQSCSQCL